MLLYSDDINGFDLAVDTLPSSHYCDTVQREYKAGKKVLVSNGTRWVDPASAERRLYACRAGDTGCQNKLASITSSTKDRQNILENCKRASRNSKS